MPGSSNGSPVPGTVPRYSNSATMTSGSAVSWMVMRDRAEGLASADETGRAFYDFFAHMVADAAGKIAIAEALADAGGDAPGRAAQASDELKRAVGVLLGRAQEAGA